MKALHLGVSLVLTLFVSAVPVSAESADYGLEGQTPILRILDFLQSLDLTKQQKTEMAALVKAHREGIRSRTEEVKNTFEELAEVVNQDTFNEEEVRNSFKKLAAAGEELAVERAQLMNQVRSVLTDEQKSLVERAKTKLKKKIEYRRSFARAVFDAWIDRLAGE